MGRFLVVSLVLVFVSAPASAHWWYPLGWSGPYAGGGTTSDHPENLCKNYAAYACIVSGTETFGIPLEKWPIQVWNSAGLDTTYYTNDTRTPGWIVVIGVTGLTWGFRPIPGANERTRIYCQMFSPGQAGGVASVSWGSSRYYYQATFAGSFGGGPCVSY